MSASGDIDPRRANAAPPRKRRRRKRHKPAPLASQKDSEAETVERLKALPISPGVMLEQDGGEWVATAPHDDQELWTAQMAVAFGTRSLALVHTFADQLKELCPQDWDDDAKAWKTNEREWNALLALVADHQPENASQAALAAQMAAVHLMTLRLSKDALNNGGMVMEKSAALASKLARTYTMQCEAMQALKGKRRTAKQSISVTRESHHHQHMHWHREGGAENNDGGPQEPRADTIEGRATLSGPCEVHRLPVPGTSDAREASLSQARRAKSGREAGKG